MRGRKPAPSQRSEGAGLPSTGSAMVRLKQERLKELFEPFEREAGLMPFSFDVTVEFAEEHLVYRAKKTLNPAPPLGLPGVENTRRILRSTTTCSMCFEVKSEPLSV
jgi:hypothetical protein